MTKSQFNIKISKDLLTQVKRQAMRSGKSLTQHITDLITNSLADNENNYLYSSSEIRNLEQRLLKVESIVINREYSTEKSNQFNNSEAINCTKFMKGIFEQEIKKGNYINRNEAFDDFYNHINNHGDISQIFVNRLKEIMLNDLAKPWTGKELNELNGYSKCNCPIRKGLINWTGLIDFPSQQEICERGEELLQKV